MTNTLDDAPAKPVRPELHIIVPQLAAHIHPDRIGTGAVAQLRRMEPCGALPPVFWGLLYEKVSPDPLDDRQAERGWALIMHALALMAPQNHQQGVRPGAVLRGDEGYSGDRGYSEMRFVRLLRAEGERFAGEIATVCRWCANKGQPFDMVLLARLILARFGDPRFSVEIETHKLARDYFRPAKTETSKESL
jgi:hypothetical protein